MDWLTRGQQLLTPQVRKALRFASALVKDDRLPSRGDGVVQLAAKALSIVDAAQTEFGAGGSDFTELEKEGLVPIYSEAFVRFFFESKLRTLFTTQSRSLNKRYQCTDARTGDQRVVFLRTEGSSEYEERVFVPVAFDLGAMRESLWSLYPNGLLLSVTQDGWRTRSVFLDLDAPELEYMTAKMQSRTLGLAHLCSEPGGPQSLLFLGPAGTGKTLTTQVLAQQMGRSLLRIDATALKEMGLKEMEFLLRFFAPGVLAVEDFDRVPEGQGSARLLLLLERIRRITPGTLVILSANDATKIDYAALRGERIDWITEFDLPDAEERQELIGPVLANLDWPVRAKCEGLCHANLVRIAKCARAGGNATQVVRVMLRLQELSEKSKEAEKGANPDTKPVG